MKLQSLLVSSALTLFGACSSSSVDVPEESSATEVCFVGDSITDLWDLDYYFYGFKIHKHAVSGARLQELDVWNIQDCKGLPTVFLMGTNNIGNISADSADAPLLREFAADYLIERALKLEASPLLYVSILPRNEIYQQDTLVNEYIKQQNQVVVRKLDSLGADFKFIDVFDDFIEKGNVIKSELFKDGLHPNDAGYDVLATKIWPYLLAKNSREFSRP